MKSKNNANKTGHYTNDGPDYDNRNIVHKEYKEELTMAEKRIATGEAAAPRGEEPKIQPDKHGITPEADEAE